MHFDGEIIFESSDFREGRDGQIKKTADGTIILNMMRDDDGTNGTNEMFIEFDVALEETIQWFLDNFENCRK